MPQECHKRVSHTTVQEECQARVFCKSGFLCDRASPVRFSLVCRNPSSTWFFKTCIRVRGFYQVYFGDFPLPSKGIVVVIILKSRLMGRLGSFQACNGSPKALSGLHLGWKVDGMWPDINGIPQTTYGPKSFYGDLIVIFEITQIKCKPVLDG